MSEMPISLPEHKVKSCFLKTTPLYFKFVGVERCDSLHRPLRPPVEAGPPQELCARKHGNEGDFGRNRRE